MPASKIEGKLLKWTNFLLGWQIRHFVFENGLLSYHKVDQEGCLSNCRGSINVMTADVQNLNGLDIKVELHDYQWFLRAKDAAEKAKWLEAFQKCKRYSMDGKLQQWINVILGWTDRYFVLENSILTYYTLNPESSLSNCRGSINILRVQIRDTGELKMDLVQSDCVWYLRAKDGAEKKKWLKAFKRCKTNPPPLSSVENSSEERLLTRSLDYEINSQKALNEKIKILKQAFPLVTGWTRGNPKDVFLDKHVAQALKCPVCFEIFENGVYQCKEGHGVCAQCYPKMVSCPVCRQAYGPEMLRNRLIEDLVVNSEMQCPAAGYGCKYKSNVKGMERHVSGCPWFALEEKLEPLELEKETTLQVERMGWDRSQVEQGPNEPAVARDMSNLWLGAQVYMLELIFKFCGIVLLFAITYVITFFSPMQVFLLFVVWYLYSLINYIVTTTA